MLWWSVSFSLNNIADFLTFANTWEHSWISSAATSTTLHSTSSSLHYLNEVTANIGTSLVPSKGLCCYCLFYVLQNPIKLPNINFRNSMRTCKGPFRTNHFQNYHQNIHAQPIWIQKLPYLQRFDINSNVYNQTFCIWWSTGHRGEKMMFTSFHRRHEMLHMQLLLCLI